MVLNDQGEDTVTLPTGDFNGKLWVTAQAWMVDDFSSSEDKVVVATSIITGLNTPRFLVSGGTVRLVLDLNNLTDKPRTLQVHLIASGLVTLSESQLSSVQLASEARSTLFIPVSALAGFGNGQVNAAIGDLSLPGETFAPLQKQRRIGVCPAFPAQTINSDAVL